MRAKRKDKKIQLRTFKNNEKHRKLGDSIKITKEWFMRVKLMCLTLMQQYHKKPWLTRIIVEGTQQIDYPLYLQRTTRKELYKCNKKRIIIPLMRNKTLKYKVNS